MWESFNQLPIWLRATIILFPMGLVGFLAVYLSSAIRDKIKNAEKLHAGKDGFNLEDLDNKAPDKIEPAATNEVK